MSKSRNIADLGSNDVIETSATGVDVTGTVTADGLTVDDGGIGTATDSIKIKSGWSSPSGLKSIAFEDQSSNTIGQFGVSYSGGVGSFEIDSLYNSGNNSNKVFKVSAGGDVSFYEDTGTTAKMVWDASAESLGIGTSSPSANLDVEGAVPVIRLSDTDISSSWSDNKEMGRLEFYTTDGSGNAPYDTAYISAVNGFSGGTLPSGELVFATATYNASGGAVERMRIDDEGNVGIGTDTVTSLGTGITVLEIKGNSSSQSDRSGAVNLTRYDGTLAMSMYHADGASILRSFSTYPMIFNTNGSERARIDSSGNVLFGKTTADNTTEGFTFYGEADGVSIVKASGSPLILNRLTNDGNIATFRKDGTTVGSIGVDSGNEFYIADNSNTGLRFSGGGNVNIIPCDSNGATRDNAIDLGYDAGRFDDIYATNGTIQTSDRNEKQDIETLSDAEQRVAQACKGLLRKFRWIDSVAEKGDDARIHFGIIAQDLRDAFEAEGLDAGRYAMFTSATWTDEETGEERTRLGVRYPELLAFIISAL